jgi:hypothetical protein
VTYRITPKDLTRILHADPAHKVTSDTNPDAAADCELRNTGDLGGATPAYRLTPARDKETLEERFERMWQEHRGPALAKEYRFHHERRWRFDFWHEPTQTAIELEGGTWTGGRHTTGTGYSGDCEKYNAAAMLGIPVLRLTADMVDSAHMEQAITFLQQRQRVADENAAWQETQP